jgi:hypothetical protein
MLKSEGSGLHFASIRDMWKWDFCIHFENKHTRAKYNEYDSIYSFFVASYSYCVSFGGILLNSVDQLHNMQRQIFILLAIKLIWELRIFFW